MRWNQVKLSEFVYALRRELAGYLQGFMNSFKNLFSNKFRMNEKQKSKLAIQV